ncbi:hypothetical protein EW145_g7421 [Phellinidium pouzarii]|uniref:Methyltransferase domain-containing protein n=1 Tax=Phellinidium pouzarii TaxID=167371 RepID=A0A4S4KJB3_9AGAM|nr:hypothetical protein EW145_g7421 [Phellinidium pouzarii]
MTDNQPSTAASIPHVSDRVFHNYPGAAYILPSDEQEAERLRLQHHVWKAAFEGKILLPPFRDQASYVVLDSGTGADIASQLSPRAILHGIDIEKRLFPPSHPSNMSFSITSITSLPDEWSNKFNFVHQRLLVLALKHKEWPLAVEQIFRVLSPGGWVQFGEFGDWRAGPITEKHRRMHKALLDSRDLNLDIHADLPELLRKASFTNITVEKRTIPLGSWAGKEGVDSRNDIISVFRSLKASVLRSGGLGFVETEEDFDQFIDAVEKEWDETEGAEVNAFIIYAQRPTQ